MNLWFGLILALFATPLQARVSGSFPVFAYVPEYRFGGIDWDAAGAHVTHVILFSLEVGPDGSLAARDRFPNPEIYAKVRAAAEKHGLKVLICFGGWGRSNGYSNVVQSKVLRQRFLDNLAAFLEDNHLDGVDYNWEYPQSDAEWRGLVSLFQETRDLLESRSGLLTMAFYPGQERVLSQYPAVFETVDYFHSMTYDQQGRHSTVDFALKSMADAIKIMPRNRFTLGLPFYGRDTRNGEAKTYDEILKATPSLKPSADEVGHIYYNGYNTIKKKTIAAIEARVGGVMIWELGQDTAPSHPASLLQAISAARREKNRYVNEEL